MASLLIGGAVAGGAAAASSAVSAGSIISLVLSGIATVVGVVATMDAAEQDAQAQDMQAIDAEREQPLESLQGINRRTGIKRELMAALGAQDTAYAASGVDLSFGTARQARQDAFREADLALTTDSGTQMTRQGRLAERAANYRSAAKATRQAGKVRGVGQLLSFGAQAVGAFK
jgi:hypothetical protein